MTEEQIQALGEELRLAIEHEIKEPLAKAAAIIWDKTPHHIHNNFRELGIKCLAQNAVRDVVISLTSTISNMRKAATQNTISRN